MKTGGLSEPAGLFLYMNKLIGNLSNILKEITIDQHSILQGNNSFPQNNNTFFLLQLRIVLVKHKDGTVVI
ncbi:hypothetical protein IW15_19310 [Chryseobacterium soli]|uniref:Uncharacterized protein n=1 Tax=Chryseobacterium soli TaxID=445961 RepID=A0A086A1C6_9FLAO|nr:hypothetical protein IW15_19310 [Chryseobacterium soli]